MRSLLIFLLIIPGACGFIFCMYFALLDWRILQTTQAHFEQVAAHSKDWSVLFVAEANQNIHRINLFADVVWALMGAILAAIGLHGLCTNTRMKSET